MGDVTPASEEWRAVVGFEGAYEVSDLGRVRSLDRVVVATVQGRPRRRRMRGRILTPTLGAYYFMVALGRGNHRYVHTLVAEAFLGPRPEGMEICHGPDGQQDNRLANLSYGTHAKNNGPDKARDGTNGSGERGPNAKLTWEQVNEIRRIMPVPLPRARSKEARRHMPTQQSLAEQFGVSRWAIHDIITGRRWRPEFRRDAS